MKRLSITILTFFLFINCIDKKGKTANTLKKYAVFGDTIDDKHTLNADEVADKFTHLKAGDTLPLKFKSKILSVCKVKGCWMNLELTQKDTVFVKFKDYSFFVPRNAQGNEVIVEGKAFLSVETVAEQRHYAQDAGASPEEIQKITSPKKSFSFVANGVLIKK